MANSKRPISKGDKCKVIDGVFRKDSPNIGKTVTVQTIQGNHSKLGVIWSCTGEDLIAFDDSKRPDGSVDFPAIWLERIEGPPAAIKAKKRYETA